MTTTLLARSFALCLVAVLAFLCNARLARAIVTDVSFNMGEGHRDLTFRCPADEAQLDGFYVQGGAAVNPDWGGALTVWSDWIDPQSGHTYTIGGATDYFLGVTGFALHADRRHIPAGLSQFTVHIDAHAQPLKPSPILPNLTVDGSVSYKCVPEPNSLLIGTLGTYATWLVTRRQAQ